MTLVDAGAEAARAVRDLLEEQDACADRPMGSASYYTSDRAADFQRIATLFLGEEMSSPAQQIDISRY